MRLLLDLVVATGTLLLRGARLLLLLFLVWVAVAFVRDKLAELSEAEASLMDVQRRLGEAEARAQAIEAVVRDRRQRAAALRRQATDRLAAISQHLAGQVERAETELRQRVGDLEQTEAALEQALGQVGDLEEAWAGCRGRVRRFVSRLVLGVDCADVRWQLDRLLARRTSLVNRLRGLGEAAEQAREALAVERLGLVDVRTDPEYAATRARIDAADGELSGLEADRRRAREERAGIAAERDALRSRLDDMALAALALLRDRWRSSWPVLLWTVCMLLLLPYFWRLLLYAALGWLVGRRRPIRLADATDNDVAALSDSEPTLELALGCGQTLWARAEFVQLAPGGTDRPGDVRRQTKLLWRWRRPFVSYAAGLHLLTRIETAAREDGGEAAVVGLGAGHDPDLHLAALELDDHPGFVARPSRVVAIRGDVRVTPRWSLGRQGLARWQLRHYVFSGTGTLVLCGRGGLSATLPGERGVRIDHEHLVAFDATLALRAVRTETLLPYLLRRTALVDDGFEGQGLVVREAAAGAARGSAAERSWDVFLGALGKLLGF